ncbi:unnamed protein product [Rotaria sp. Silwood1]|nr:unnamed protein product [Rotaria sp. Silwood1]CAF0856267.1 unnamed protein product [Rotaria sp. Silwood1]
MILPIPNEYEEIIRYIYMIIYPIIFIIGIIGNLLSSLIFSITDLSQTSCGIYFLLLAIYDSIGLLGGLHHCLILGYHISIPNATYCRARNFLAYTSIDMVSWMIVAISVDRYVKVKFPIHARIYCTKKLTVIVACILMTILILKNIHLATVFIGDFTDNAADNCDPNPDYPTYVKFFENVWPWIDLTTFVLLPFIIVTSCNIFIIKYQYKRHLKFGLRNLDRSIIRFLLISSISLIICNFPVSITIVIYPYISKNNAKNDHNDKVVFVFNLLRLPAYASLAFNFYLYYYSSNFTEAGQCQVHNRPDYLSLASNNNDENSNRLTVSTFANNLATILGLSPDQTEKSEQPMFYSTRPLEIPSSTWLFHIEGLDRLSNTGISLDDNGEFDIDSIHSKLSQTGNADALSMGSVIISSKSDLNNFEQALKDQLSRIDQQATVNYIVIVCDDCKDDNAAQQIQNQLKTKIDKIISNDPQTLAMTLITKESARVRRARQVETTSANITIAEMYSDEYPVMFNLFFWTSLVLALIVISIAYVFLTLDPGADTIIYRMTTPRLKVD